MKKITYLLYPNLGKKSLKSQKTPIYLMLMINGKKSEVRLKLELNDSQIKFPKNKMRRLNQQNYSVNNALNEVNIKVKTWIKESENSSSEINIAHLRDLLSNKRPLIKYCPTISSYVDKYYVDRISSIINLELGTKKNYKKAITLLKL